MKAIWHLWAVIFASVVVPMLKAKLGIDASHVHGIHGVLGVVAAVLGVAHLREMSVGALLDRIAALEAKAGIAKLAGLFLAALTLGSLGGCANMATMSDADFAAWVKSQARTDVGASLTLAMAVDQAKASEIKTDALVAKGILDGPIAQLFSGASAGTVTLSTVNAAIPLLKNKLAGVKNGPAIAAAVQLAFGQVVNQLQLPGIPQATLNARTAMAIAGVFSGSSDGIGDATK